MRATRMHSRAAALRCSQKAARPTRMPTSSGRWRQIRMTRVRCLRAGFRSLRAGSPIAPWAAFEDAIQRGFKSAEVYTRRGRVLSAKGETDKAIEEFDHALKLKPISGDALTARGAAWLKKKDYGRALADIEKAMSLDRADLESYLIRAGIYEAQGKAELAIADLRKATQFAPRTVFETLAQTEARKRINRLTKATPCPGAGEGATCL